MSVSVIENPYAYKLIYVFAIPDEDHAGLLKVGETTVQCDLPPVAARAALMPNCQMLNDAAKKRIDQYTQTAGIAYTLLHTELAVGPAKVIGDTDVHRVLINSGHPREKPTDGAGQEWFRTNLTTVKNAIRAAKEGRNALSVNEVSHVQEIILRPSQREAVDLAKRRFKAGVPKVLWNAKMRFGKTIAALMLAKEMGCARVFILTHRPAVEQDWRDDFNKVFPGTDFYFQTHHTTGFQPKHPNIVYFTSLQDMRESAAVSGRYKKNDDVYGAEWDLLIVDEAHEGTQTDLGSDVLDRIRAKHRLALSGTPYNIESTFPPENVYTWDYMAEQNAKARWAEEHGGDSNPYAGLPQMRLNVYDLSDYFHGSEYAERTLEGHFFSFREFLRTWTGDQERDLGKMPAGAQIGEFVHAAEVRRFLALLHGAEENRDFPFATKAYREALRQTVGKGPGVKEAKALAEALRQDPIFRHFKVVNVAGDGDEERASDDARKDVEEAIKNHPYTITLTCGRLTTGVTIPQWTGALVLAGGEKVEAITYLQTIFRVQSPYTDEEGRVKELCYVFDFAPDRVLSVLPKMCMNNTAPAGGTQGGLREQLNALLKNFLPVLAFKGGKMSPVDPNHIFRHIRRAEAEKAIRSGFSDESIYNTDMLNAKHIDSALFNGLRAKIGRTQKGAPVGDFELSASPLTDAEREEAEGAEKKPKPQLTEEEKEKLRRLREERKQRENAIAILRGISIRLPLLIYGADVNYSQDISIHDFVDLVDDVSWEEFMPTGVSKEEFLQCIPYYDEETVRVAGHEIRALAKAADEHAPMQRVRAIARVFGYFRNPDKETVLTPWRIVNRHLAETVGGWCFMDEAYAEPLEEPRWVEQEGITQKVFGEGENQVLEVNSKSGLYPLYVAYTLFRRRLDVLQAKGEELTLERQWQVWDTVVRENLFVICKTKMALTITRRTLLGYRAGTANLECYNNLIHDLRHNQDKVVRNLRNPATWGLKERLPMHFNAIVGNPPYHVSDGGAKASALPLYNLFFNLAKTVEPDYVSMIMEARWMIGGRGLDEFRAEMLKDHQLVVLHDFMDSRDCFPNVDIKGGVCFVLWERGADRPCQIYTYKGGKLIEVSERFLAYEGSEVFLRMEAVIPIIEKVRARQETPFSSIVSRQKPYGLRGDFFADPGKYGLPAVSSEPIKGGYAIWGLDDKRRTKCYIPADYPLPKQGLLDKMKAFYPRNYGDGVLGEMPGDPIYAKPGECCTETFIEVGPFSSEAEAKRCDAYLRTKFARFLIGVKKNTQGAAKAVYDLLPLQDFSREWTDAALYKKYGLTAEEVAFIEATIPDAAAKQPKKTAKADAKPRGKGRRKADSLE